MGEELAAIWTEAAASCDLLEPSAWEAASPEAGLGADLGESLRCGLIGLSC